MFHVKQFILFLKFILIWYLVNGQSEVGQWADHFYYGKVVGVCFSNDGRSVGASNMGLFFYDGEDKSIQKFNKIHGLSDINISTIENIDGKIYIGYKNGNIDVLIDEKIINFPDIKLKTISADKQIVRFKKVKTPGGNFYYILTNFGVIKFDPDKNVILENYKLTSNFIKTNDIDIFKDTIYVAAENGVYYLPLNKNPEDFNNWIKITSFNNFNMLACFAHNNNLYIVKENNVPGQNDSIFVKTNNGFVYTTNYDNYKFVRVRINEQNDITFTYRDRVVVRDNNGQVLDVIYQYNGKSLNPLDAIYDRNFGRTIIGDNELGLIDKYNNEDIRQIKPNGPERGSFFRIKYQNNTIIGVPGIWDLSSFNPTYYTEGIHIFRDNQWKTILRDVFPLDTAFDLTGIAIDPKDNKHFFIGSYGNGLFEYKNDEFYKHYNPANSPLNSNSIYYFVPISDMEYDRNGNLWIVNSAVPEALHMYNQQNWFSINLSPYQNNEAITRLHIDQYNQKWLIQSRTNTVIIYDDNDTPGNISDDRKIALSSSNGSIPDGDYMYCIAEDKNGLIWLGTNKGIYLINNPSQILDLGYGKAQEILITQDGNVQKLFETEAIFDIEVDGANRKWVATANSGVFLMSSDFSSQIEHFTFENSPLVSNTVYDICINPITGDVYFATDKGLMSYRGFATEGENICDNYLIYPNPVKKGYNGYLTIRQIVADSKVTIMTIDGYKIYENNSLGGQFFWDMKNFKGEKIPPGVYIAVCTPPSGEKSCPIKFTVLSD